MGNEISACGAERDTRGRADSTGSQLSCAGLVGRKDKVHPMLCAVCVVADISSPVQMYIRTLTAARLNLASLRLVQMYLRLPRHD